VLSKNLYEISIVMIGATHLSQYFFMRNKFMCSVPNLSFKVKHL
jgi:hypothetical protein